MTKRREPERTPLLTGDHAINAFNPDDPSKPLKVTFPSGPGVIRWDKVCKKCGKVVGGCFSGPNLPEPRINEGSICPWCKASWQDIELRQCKT